MSTNLEISQTQSLQDVAVAVGALSASWFWEQLRLTGRTTRYGETHDPSSNPDRYEILAPAWVTDIDVSCDFTEISPWLSGRITCLMSIQKRHEIL